MKEESTEDRGLAKLITGKLLEHLAPEPRTAQDCPDVETLACYFDRSLTEAEREAFETHLMGCLRCQEQIAGLARQIETDEAPAMITDGAPAAVEEEPDPGWHFNLAWVGFALVIVVAVGFWQRSRITSFFQPPGETAENVSPPAPETPAGKEGAASHQLARREEALTASDNRLGAASGAAKALAEGKDGAPSKTEAAGELAKSKEAAPATSMARNASSSESRAVAGGAASAEPGAIAMPSQRAGLGAVVQPGRQAIEMEPAKPNLRMTERDTAGTQLSAAAPQPPPAPATAGQAETASGAPKMTVQGFTSRYTPKWRVGRRGVIQKADPNGRWVAVASGVDSDLFDISFAGSSAGWAVGHGGLVLRTTDGGDTWTLTTSPTAEDIVHISATSGLAARVITRRNILYSTSDGGNSWTSAPQQ